MDPTSLLITLVMKNPNALNAVVERMTAPGVVDTARMQQSVADTASEILRCYHRTARFGSADVLGGPWNRQAQYGAANSLVMTIRYSGVTATPYEMTVALMGKQNAVRTAVLRDTALVPYSTRCELENWKDI